MRDEYRLRRLNLDRLVKLAKIGDKKAMGMILEKLEPMVKSIVSKYYGTWAEFEDFIQIGFVGIMQAVYNFDENSNTKFTTFAYLNISSEVKSFLTYLNRQKNKVLSDAVSMENIFDKMNEDSEYYFGDTDETNTTDSQLEKYVIESTINELEEQEKQIVKMWIDGYSYKEISELSELSFKKVDNTIQKIKTSLTKRKELIENIKNSLGGV